MQLFDCTLRDGANDVGLGFTAEMTTMIIRGLLAANIKIIEFGSAHGIGSAAPGHASPLTDEAYLDLAAEFYRQAELGMFLGAARATPQIVDLSAKKGLGFLRVGANAGSGETSKEVVKLVKSKGLRAYYSLMKGYILSARELAAEGALLEKAGTDAITIMDSAARCSPSRFLNMSPR
jgi:isopropylmalate/homocitrate/citramalate synthase